MKSKFFTLNVNDATKALIMACLSVGLSEAYQIVSIQMQSGRMPTTAEALVALKVGAGAAAAYLMKNLFTNSDDKFGKTEHK